MTVSLQRELHESEVRNVSLLSQLAHLTSVANPSAATTSHASSLGAQGTTQGLSTSSSQAHAGLALTASMSSASIASLLANNNATTPAGSLFVPTAMSTDGLIRSPALSPVDTSSQCSTPRAAAGAGFMFAP